jgi:WD40-like Beta Propeller Repeat
VLYLETAERAGTHRSVDSLDDLDQLVDSVALLPREADEVAGSRGDGPPLRRPRDRHTPSAAKVQQAFVPELPERPENGVRVDAEHGREVARGREAVTGRRFAVRDRTADFRSNLLVELRRRAAVDLDADHGASDTSVIVRTLPTAPPRRPKPPQADPLEALIKEARERQRRRRIRLTVLLGAIVLLGAGAYLVAANGGSKPLTATRSPRSWVAAGRCPPGDLGTVAFIRGGALALLDLHECRTRVLVPSHVAGPVQFSVDGRYVAFNGGFVSTNGGEVHRTSGGGTWSPRADVLAVGTKRGGLRLASSDGRARTLLPDGWGVLTVAFSPDGRTIAVSRARSHNGTPPALWHQEIWLIDLGSGARRMIFHVNPPAFAPAWLQGFSPDGRWLIFWEDTQGSASLAADGLPLRAIRLSGGRAVTVINGGLPHRDFLTWCGNALVYVINRGGRQVTLGDGIAAAAPPTWRPRTILPAGGRRSWNSLSCPTPAAAERGGGALVVAGGPTSQDLPFGHEHRSLWILSPTPRAKPQPLRQADPPADETDELPMWSGDGRWILFVRTRFVHAKARTAMPRGRGVLYALNPFGGNLVVPIERVGASSNYYGAYGWAGQIDWHR